MDRFDLELKVCGDETSGGDGRRSSQTEGPGGGSAKHCRGSGQRRLSTSDTGQGEASSSLGRGGFGGGPG